MHARVSHNHATILACVNLRMRMKQADLNFLTSNNLLKNTHKWCFYTACTASKHHMYASRAARRSSMTQLRVSCLVSANTILNKPFRYPNKKTMALRKRNIRTNSTPCRKHMNS